ncbi:hypothetical protein [Streptosporangium saharense]|uniref:hypothetical protein n=1 Tax=Streptosporangium saharense TaxID=1706840 RepID=UPI00342C6779
MDDRREANRTGTSPREKIIQIWGIASGRFGRATGSMRFGERVADRFYPELT